MYNIRLPPLWVLREYSGFTRVHLRATASRVWRILLTHYYNYSYGQFWAYALQIHRVMMSFNSLNTFVVYTIYLVAQTWWSFGQIFYSRWWDVPFHTTNLNIMRDGTTLFETPSNRLRLNSVVSSWNEFSKCKIPNKKNDFNVQQKVQ